MKISVGSNLYNFLKNIHDFGYLMEKRIGKFGFFDKTAKKLRKISEIFTDLNFPNLQIGKK
jgi:hypothetical protein